MTEEQPAYGPQDENPFSTRFVRPGAIPFRFANRESLAGLLDRLQQHGGWGQIVGPHGTGKSTLLQLLVAALRDRGHAVHFHALTAQQHSLTVIDSIPDWQPSAFVAIDGYEQLWWWQRHWLQLIVRRRQAGLIVTTHRDLGLPYLYSTAVSLELVQSVVQELLRGRPPLLAADAAAQAWSRHPANLREILFDLYDQFEVARRLS